MKYRCLECDGFSSTEFSEDIARDQVLVHMGEEHPECFRMTMEAIGAPVEDSLQDFKILLAELLESS